MYAIRSYYELAPDRLTDVAGLGRVQRSRGDRRAQLTDALRGRIVRLADGHVITSYSIHYTKLYENPSVEIRVRIFASSGLLISSPTLSPVNRQSVELPMLSTSLLHSDRNNFV